MINGADRGRVVARAIVTVRLPPRPPSRLPLAARCTSG